MFNAKEVNYIRYTVKFRYKYKSFIGLRLKKGLAYGLINFCISFFLSFFKNPISFHNITKKSDGIVIFYNGRNQYNALIKIYECLKLRNIKAVLIHTSELPMWRSYIYSIGSIRDFWNEYRKSNSEEKQIISNELATYWRSYGDYKLIYQWIKRSHISNIFIANDHDTLMRSLLFVCRELNITTTYVQHAAVTDKFPPLISSYSFLDGIDSLDKYLVKKKTDSEIFVVGGSRFDLINTEGIEKGKSIGIALTRSDDKDKWEELIDNIKKNYSGSDIILRPHPRMDINFYKDYCQKVNIKISDPSKESSFVFLTKLCLLIANETSTHLDALLMHCPTVLYTGLATKGLRDHYGMVKNGLLKYCDTFSDLKVYIDNPQTLTSNSECLQKYNASSFTRFEYNVSELIVRIVVDKEKNIEGLINKQGITYIDYGS